MQAVHFQKFNTCSLEFVRNLGEGLSRTGRVLGRVLKLLLTVRHDCADAATSPPLTLGR